jgi:hypothetical protein
MKAFFWQLCYSWRSNFQLTATSPPHTPVIEMCYQAASLVITPLKLAIFHYSSKLCPSSIKTAWIISPYSPELFVRGLLWSPSQKISSFENPSDSDSACLFVYAFILFVCLLQCRDACICELYWHSITKVSTIIPSTRSALPPGLSQNPRGIPQPRITSTSQTRGTKIHPHNLPDLLSGRGLTHEGPSFIL